MTPSTPPVVLRHDIDSVRIAGHWIWDHGDHEPDDMATCLFRRRFAADELGPEPRLRISADSRYRAYLNGELISRGPCRGTEEDYYYETIPLAGRLADGENVLAVEVRWYGSHNPQAEIHVRPGLWAMLGSDEANPAAIVTDALWKTYRSEAHAPDPIPAPRPLSGYCVVDPCEDIDYRRFPVDWHQPSFDDDSWLSATPFRAAQGRGQLFAESHWFHELTGREIPPMEEKPFAPAAIHEVGAMTLSADPRRLRSIEGELVPATGSAPEVFWGDTAEPLVLEGAGTHYVIVNMGELVTGYPRLTVEAPAGTMVEFRYAEALSRNRVKAVRDDPAAGTVEGYFDTFTCRDGRTVAEPFVWRTFRFMRIAVHHPGGPAALARLETTYTAYPFRAVATFESSDPLHARLWDVSWRTARLCAHEHYEDCPYYEQLQYVGDTRLQALISYMVAGDFRLARQALWQWYRTRRGDGITKSRTPSRSAQQQVIPQFSLIWILFLEDFYLYSGEADIVAELWDGVESVLRWFERFVVDGVLVDAPYWVFTDWSMPREPHHCGSMGELNMRWIEGLQCAARLAAAIGKTDRAAGFAARADAARDAVRARFYSAEDGLFADELDGRVFGEHAGILAILYDVVDQDEQRPLLERLNTRTDLARTTIYYSYYTFRAYEKLGLHDKAYADRLYNWTDQLALNATTWFESPGAPRSDCHAWGSWIMCDLLTSILGITPAEPGFGAVRIAPHLMGLSWARGSAPTVRGTISVDLRRDGDNILYDIALPDDMPGVLVTPDGDERILQAGRNQGRYST